MTDSLLLHSRTKKQVERTIKKPPHAILIYGPAGSGKRALAELIASRLLEIESNKLSVYPYFKLVQKSANKQEISIDSIREVIRQLNLKPVVGRKKIDRVVLIDEMHLASLEAQNALLKIIEEPPAGTVFILTATSETAVLSTIASRAEKLPVLPVSLQEAINFYKASFQEQEIDSAWQLSGGFAGLLNALLQESINHPLKQSVETAKKVLSLDRYNRLLIFDHLSSDKNEFKVTLDALERIIASLHHIAIKADNRSQALKLLEARKQVTFAIQSLQHNTSPRLVALSITLGLPI